MPEIEVYRNLIRSFPSDSTRFLKIEHDISERKPAILEECLFRKNFIVHVVQRMTTSQHDSGSRFLPVLGFIHLY